MSRFPKWMVSGFAVAVLVGWTTPTQAAETSIGGKIKSVNPGKNLLVLATGGKDITLHVEANTRIFQGTLKGANIVDLKAGDELAVLFDAGTLKNTARYIAVNSDANKDMAVSSGTVKSVNAEKREVVIANAQNQKITYSFPEGAKIHLSSKEANFGALKDGDKVFTASVKKGDRMEIRDLWADRN